MSRRDRIRTAWHLLRRGDIPADVWQRIADEIDQDNELVDRALLHRAVELVATHTDYTAAQAAVENFPLGRLRPTGQPILSLVGSPR